jgi:hypothetical protein
MGRNGGHQRGDSMAAYGEVFMATVTPARRLYEKAGYTPLHAVRFFKSL